MEDSRRTVYSLLTVQYHVLHHDTFYSALGMNEAKTIKLSVQYNEFVYGICSLSTLSDDELVFLRT